MKRLAMYIVVSLALAASAQAQTFQVQPLTPVFVPVFVPLIGTATAPSIVAQDGTYLGKLSLDRFAPDSISNPFGPYGSRFSPTSIQNPFSVYGSRFSPLSPTNPFASDPPWILTAGRDGGIYVTWLRPQ